MRQRIIPFGVIGCGLMGREFASAAARWCHLVGVDFVPQIVAACNRSPAGLDWFRAQVPTLQLATTDYHELLDSPQVEAVYVAVPHDQHQEIYTEAIHAGKHLLAEKPFGIDLAANQAILQAVQENPSSLVRCSSQFPFFPGAYRIFQWLGEDRFGKIIEIEAGFWHSSDLDPHKPINWKRKIAFNGEYGCMGDLGMHVLHIPLRVGWMPSNVRALLSKIYRERPDKDGTFVPCETWDNAILACEINTPEQQFPMMLVLQAYRPRACQYLVPAHLWDRMVCRIFHPEPQAAALPSLYPRCAAGMAYVGCSLPVSVSCHYRQYLRVRFLRRYSANVGGLL